MSESCIIVESVSLCLSLYLSLKAFFTLSSNPDDPLTNTASDFRHREQQQIHSLGSLAEHITLISLPSESLVCPVVGGSCLRCRERALDPIRRRQNHHFNFRSLEG